MAKLTSKTAKTTTPATTDLIHVVNVDDTTDDPTGSSNSMTRATFMGGGLSTIQSCIVLARTGADQSMSALQVGDVVMYKSSSELIIAQILAAITTVPDDLRDTTKATRWIDATPLLSS